MKKEQGDVLWYVGAVAKEQYSDLEHVKTINYSKLRSRKDNNTIQGSGDNR